MNNFEKKLFLQIVKVKGQTQGQGQIKVKVIWKFSLFCMLLMWYGWFMKSSKIVNIQPILLKIDTHIAWTYPM